MKTSRPRRSHSSGTQATFLAETETNLAVFVIGLIAVLTIASSCDRSNQSDNAHKTPSRQDNVERNIMSNAQQSHESSKTELATFGAGCFWCVEAVFQRLDGVVSVESGYSGGKVDNPTYEQVCNGTTGHAEVCQISYDPSKIQFEELLEVFWKTHDPTTLNRQGNDFGTQYRSVVFHHNELQKEVAEKYKTQLDKSDAWPNPIVTEISPFTKFYKAEKYHQNYFNLNPNQGYCRAIIQPKIEKFAKDFGERTKSE